MSHLTPGFTAIDVASRVLVRGTVDLVVLAGTLVVRSVSIRNN